MRYRHIRDEEPYFHQIAQMLDLLETKKVHRVNGRNGYKVRCPRLRMQKWWFWYQQDQDTFILMCANDSVVIEKTSINL